MAELLTAGELAFLQDSKTWKLKQQVTQKLQAVFGSVSAALEKAASATSLPPEVISSGSKISRGENYLGFPWMILDYPRLFGKSDVFAFRSLCWWSNEFSFTLHLAGKYLKNPTDISEALHELDPDNYYICIAQSPWNYHFNSDNYILLKDFFKTEKFFEKDFIKISKKLSLSEIASAEETAVETFKELTGKLYLK